MLRLTALAVGLLVVIGSTRADEAISPEVLRAVKQATVYIRVEASDWGKSGSGFVVQSNGGTVLVVTNHHVAVKRPVGDLASKPGALTVVFDSGTRTERSYPAEVIASDSQLDLAVLRLTGVKDAPRPIEYATTVAPFETMSVYSFGFPFGEDLSTGKGSPAITVGRASVSSLRNGDDGELETIQIDGNLNPGNSGGPVVDSKGRLIGVAVAVLKEGQGIGFLVPAVEVTRTMAGRVGRVRVLTLNGANGKPAVRVEAEIIDPAGAFRRLTAHYLVVPPKGQKPDTDKLIGLPGSWRLPLKVEKGVASAEFTLEKVEGEVLVQVVAQRSGEEQVVSTGVRGYSLFDGVKVKDFAGLPPSSWKNYTSKDGSFALWLPASPVRQDEEQASFRIGREVLQSNSVEGETANGLVYQAESIVLPPALQRQPPFAIHGLFRAVLIERVKGRIVESDEVKSGSLVGVQYRIVNGDEVSRARVFIDLARRVRVVRVVGTSDLVDAAEAETILHSFRLPDDQFASKSPDPTPTPKPNDRPPNRRSPDTRPVIIAPRKGKEPTVIAGGSHPLFTDVAPDGGLMIGLELGLGKFFQEDVIKSVRPIYRVNGKEQFGTQRGVPPSPIITIKAKDGYAVGAITYRSGMNFDGCSLTFMKVEADKLDPSDSYESAWVGYVGNKQATRIGGDGTPVVGIAGRGSDRELNGLGILFQGQEDYEPIGQRWIDKSGRDPFIFGTIHDPLFKSVGPKGAMLIGIEAHFEKFGDKEIVRGVRPIYLIAGKEQPGEQVGDDLSNSVKLRAKDGYAVGGMSGKSEWWCHGFSLTFMKVKPDGTLDSNDSYESEWAGWNGPLPATKMDGAGKPVVGLVGKIVGTKTTALGLLFKGQEDFDTRADGR